MYWINSLVQPISGGPPTWRFGVGLKTPERKNKSDWGTLVPGINVENGIKLLPCGGGFESLHRSPASRRWRRKGKSRIWDSKIWSRDPRVLDPKMTALARASSNCKRQTRPLVRESAPYQHTRNCLTVIKLWPLAPDGCFIPRQTGWLTVGRNKRLRLRY
jgi:hypothetical protein